MFNGDYLPLDNRPSVEGVHEPVAECEYIKQTETNSKTHNVEVTNWCWETTEKITTEYNVYKHAWYGFQLIQYNVNCENEPCESIHKESDWHKKLGINNQPKYHTTWSYVFSWMAIILMQLLVTTVRIRARIKVKLYDKLVEQKEFHKRDQEQDIKFFPHQKIPYYRSLRCLKLGMLFPGGTRSKADKGSKYCFQYLANFGFYKFGVIICQIMTALLVIVRRDVCAVFYGTILIVSLLFNNRKHLSFVWIVYLLACIIGLVYQYLMLLGMPPGLCTNYNDLMFPFGISPKDNVTSVAAQTKKLRVMKWLYLPRTQLSMSCTDGNTKRANGISQWQVDVNKQDSAELPYKDRVFYDKACHIDPTTTPKEAFLIFDACQLILVLCQWMVFKREKEEKYKNRQEAGGDNEQIIDEIERITTDNAYQDVQVPNFLHADNNKTLDYIKSVVFVYSVWITLAVLCAAGIRRVTLFSLIYLACAFYMLSVVQTRMVDDIKKLTRGWTRLIIFVACVMFAKSMLVMVKEIFDDQSYGGWATTETDKSGVEKNALENLMNTGKSLLTKYMKLVYGLVLGAVKEPGNQEGLSKQLYQENESSTFTNVWDSIIWETVFLDWLCFVCLLIQKRIFESYYFIHVIFDMKVMYLLSSRGATLFKNHWKKERDEKTAEEQARCTTVLNQLDLVYKRTKRIREDVELSHHFRAVRAITDMDTFDHCMREYAEFEGAFEEVHEDLSHDPKLLGMVKTSTMEENEDNDSQIRQRHNKHLKSVDGRDQNNGSPSSPAPAAILMQHPIMDATKNATRHLASYLTTGR